MGEILQRNQCKTSITPHIDSQVQIFKDVCGSWMHKSLPKCGLSGFHGTCANACCDAGSLRSSESFLQEVQQTSSYHFATLAGVRLVIAAASIHAEEYNAYISYRYICMQVENALPGSADTCFDTPKKTWKPLKIK